MTSRFRGGPLGVAASMPPRLPREASVLILAIAAAFGADQATAAWPRDPRVNLPISTRIGVQSHPAIASDGSGGGIVVWTEVRDTTGRDIYAQRINRTGIAQWNRNGIPVCTSNSTQDFPVVVPDGSGGAIVAWEDSRGGTFDIYAQRLDPTGQSLWSSNGVAVCAATGAQGNPRIVGDGHGGAVLTWEDLRTGLGNVFAQRLDSFGTPLWTPDGAAVSTASGAQSFPTLVAGGNGGAILFWSDGRNGSNHNVYAQRVDGAGDPMWTVDGIPVSQRLASQVGPVAVQNGGGGAIVIWQEIGPIGTSDLYAQLLRADGSMPWPIPGGTPVCTAADNQLAVAAVEDDGGGAVIAWEDYRSGEADVYAQRVGGNGSLLWTLDGVGLSSAPYRQHLPALVHDASGGAVVIWQEREPADDLYAQHVSDGGALLWGSEGLGVSVANGPQLYPAAAPDGAGGAIAAWSDWRSDPNGDIYAQRVTDTGELGELLPPRLALLGVFPNPARHQATASFALPAPEVVSIDILDANGRLVRTLPSVSFPAGEHTMGWSATDDGGRSLPSGIYFVRLRAGNERRTGRFAMMP